MPKFSRICQDLGAFKIKISLSEVPNLMISSSTHVTTASPVVASCMRCKGISDRLINVENFIIY